MIKSIYQWNTIINQKKNKVVIGKYFFETNLMVEDTTFIDVIYV